MPKGYDCATPGFETPLSLDEAVELSKRERIIYLYGPGIQDAVIVAAIVREGRDDVPGIPAIAVPGQDVPKDEFYVVILGKVIRHRESREPVAFYQPYMNRGTVFSMTRQMHARIVEALRKSEG